MGPDTVPFFNPRKFRLVSTVVKSVKFLALADNFSTSLMRIDAAEKTDFGDNFDQYPLDFTRSVIRHR